MMGEAPLLMLIYAFTPVHDGCVTGRGDFFLKWYALHSPGGKSQQFLKFLRREAADFLRAFAEGPAHADASVGVVAA